MPLFALLARRSKDFTICRMKGWLTSASKRHSSCTSSGTLPSTFLMRFSAYLAPVTTCSTMRTEPKLPTPMLRRCLRVFRESVQSWSFARSRRSSKGP